MGFNRSSRVEVKTKLMLHVRYNSFHIAPHVMSLLRQILFRGKLEQNNPLLVRKDATVVFEFSRIKYINVECKHSK